MANASRDENNVPTLLGVSSVDGTTPVPVYANPTTHRLLTSNSTLSGPVSSTDTAIALWDGTTGLTLKDSKITVDSAKTGIATSALFSQTATKTVANTTSETALDSTGVGSKTIPANFFIAGRVLQVTATGIHSGTGNPHIDIKLKFGSTVILDTGSVASGNSTNTFFEVKAFITCYTTGGTGSVWAQGFYTESGGGQNSFPMTTTSATTVDTTSTQAVSITAQWDAADPGNSITCTNLIIEALS